MNIVTPPMPTRLGTQMLEASRRGDGTFDVDAFHVMEKRDNALIEDELLHGTIARQFVYSFEVAGKSVTGISVIGARHLAFHYGGLKHRIVASVRKIGTLFTFTSYPQPGMPMSVQCSVLPELADEPDAYSAIVEVQDIKTGNAVQMECQEARWDTRRDGSLYERPQYAKIAQAKAYRNAVLSLIPQDVQSQWKVKALELGENMTITADVIAEKRAGVLRFAAQHGIPISRAAVFGIGFEQIAGLSDAARTGLPAFRSALDALGLAGGAEPRLERLPAQPPPGASRPPAAAPVQQPPPPPTDPGPSGSQNVPGSAESQKTVVHSPSGFTAELLGGAGAARRFDDPVTFAQAFLAAHEAAFPIDRAELIEQNRPALLDAADASAEAAELLGDFLPADPSMTAIQLPRSRSGAPLAGAYVQAVQDALRELPADRMEAFARANRPTWQTLPDGPRLNCERALALRAQALEMPPPEAGQAAPADKDRLLADNLTADLEACTDLSALNAYVYQQSFKVPMSRLRQERPELAEEIDRLETAIRHGFGHAK